MNAWVFVISFLVGVTLLAMLLGGCAAPTVVWEGYNESFKRDHYECNRDSAVYWGGSGAGAVVAGISAKKESRRNYVDCMESRGYQQAPR